ncbi:RTC4-like domain-containing protein, partial [Mycena vulgaris]
PDIDPRTLCPYCDSLLPPQPTPYLMRLLDQTFRKTYSDPRPSNRLGRKGFSLVFAAVCHRHNFESEMIPKAEAKGWPNSINWKALSGRVREMKSVLEQILVDPGDPIVYGNDEKDDKKEEEDEKENQRCIFWEDLLKTLKDEGSKGVRGVQGQFANFHKTQPGYYGEVGATIIHQVLYDMFPLVFIEPELVRPLTPNEFIQQILVPEVGMRLVIEDMGLNPDSRSDKKQALDVLSESAGYGVTMFPVDDGDSATASGKNRDDEELMGIAEQMVMERAQKRRKELENEEQEKDGLWAFEQEKKMKKGEPKLRKRRKKREMK